MQDFKRRFAEATKREKILYTERKHLRDLPQTVHSGEPVCQPASPDVLPSVPEDTTQGKHGETPVNIDIILSGKTISAPYSLVAYCAKSQKDCTHCEIWHEQEKYHANGCYVPRIVNIRNITEKTLSPEHHKIAHQHFRTPVKYLPGYQSGVAEGTCKNCGNHYSKHKSGAIEEYCNWYCQRQYQKKNNLKEVLNE